MVFSAAPVAFMSLVYSFQSTYGLGFGELNLSNQLALAIAPWQKP